MAMRIDKGAVLAQQQAVLVLRVRNQVLQHLLPSCGIRIIEVVRAIQVEQGI